MRGADAGLLVASVLTLLSVTAAAEEGTVFYKDGGRINGDIVEVRPNQFVVIRTATGETRKIDWSEVDHVLSSATPAEPPGPPPTQPPPSPPPSPPEPEQVLSAVVVLRSNVPSTTLQLVTGRAVVGYTYGSWYPVPLVSGQGKVLCTAPCRARLPPGTQELMVSAPGAPPAYTRLNLHPGENYVAARMGSSAMITGGYAAVTVGVLSLLTGASLLFSYAFYPGSYGYPYSYSYSSAYYAWGLAGVIGGAVLTGGGVALIALGGSSVGPDSSPAAPHATSGLAAVRGLALSIPF